MAQESGYPWQTSADTFRGEEAQGTEEVFWTATGHPIRAAFHAYPMRFDGVIGGALVRFGDALLWAEDMQRQVEGGPAAPAAVGQDITPVP